MENAPSLESVLRARLVGQNEAVAEFAACIERSHFGPARSGRTKAFILLLGPTGTGKTEMVKLTARHLYGAQSLARLERFDMGEYQHSDSVLRLLGGPGQTALLGAALDRLNALGGGVLLLDEIEKAHPDLLTVLLSFDEARSTMADGSTRDLSRCYVMMTSNLGAAEASQMVHNGYSAIRRKVLHEAELCFRKETLARFTATIVMNSLDFDTQNLIARQLLEHELLVQSEHCHRWIEIADSRVISFLIGKGFSPDLGARNIRRTIEKHVGDALRPFARLDVPEEGADGSFAEIGDRWSRGLVLTVEQDALVAWPLRRSESLSRLLSQLSA
jgi:ATP-dependent Clp protease ATP-binding subunit ClpA